MKGEPRFANFSEDVEHSGVRRVAIYQIRTSVHGGGTAPARSCSPMSGVLVFLATTDVWQETETDSFGVGIQGAQGTTRIFEGGRGKAWGGGWADIGFSVARYFLWSLSHSLFSLVFHLSFPRPTSSGGQRARGFILTVAVQALVLNFSVVFVFLDLWRCVGWIGCDWLRGRG